MTIINRRPAVPLEKEELQKAESLRKALQERVKTSMLESQESHLQEKVAWKLGTADGHRWSGEIIILDTEKEKGPLSRSSQQKMSRLRDELKKHKNLLWKGIPILCGLRIENAAGKPEDLPWTLDR